MVDFADDSSTELERRITPLKVISLVEAGMWALAAIFWLEGSRAAQLLLWSAHGMVVLAFVGMVVLIYRQVGWSLPFAVFAVLTGPIGALAVYVRLRREEPSIRAREQSKRTIVT